MTMHDDLKHKERPVEVGFSDTLHPGTWQSRLACLVRVAGALDNEVWVKHKRNKKRPRPRRTDEIVRRRHWKHHQEC